MAIKSGYYELFPSHYTYSNYTSVSNATNMYNGSNSAYATINGTSKSNIYVYIDGFNFDAIPPNATVKSFTISLRASETGLSSEDYAPRLCNGTSVLSADCDQISGDSAKVYTFTGVSETWEQLKSYGSNFRVRINARRPIVSRYSRSTIKLYWIKISVSYTYPVDSLYFKDSGEWKEIETVYRKTAGEWVEIELKTLDRTLNYVKRK